MVKGILNAKELACYIINYNRKKFSSETSPIKLQKSLYFCFAYWGGFVRKSKSFNTEVKIDKSEWLFNEDIEAWVYGPALPEVYHEGENIVNFNNENLFDGNLDVKNFLDGILDEVLKVSDFKLVEISHSDSCWKKYFNPNSSKHNNVINKEDIINLYGVNSW